MLTPALSRSVRVRLLAPLLALVTLLALATSAHAATYTGPVMNFAGTFATGLNPWNSVGGGALCANYGTVSQNQRLRGDLYMASMAGLSAGQFALPADANTSQWPLEACGVSDGVHQQVLPADQYYGLAVYIPSNFSIPNRSGYTNIAEFHMQDVGGQPPICLLLHNNSVSLSILGGAYSRTSGFQYSARYHNVPMGYAIPAGHLVYGAWNEMVFHIHWAADSSGQAQFYYRAKGQSTWNAASSWSGIPTITWNAPNTFLRVYSDNISNYGTAMSQPFSIYLTDEIIGTSLSSVQAQMP